MVYAWLDKIKLIGVIYVRLSTTLETIRIIDNSPAWQQLLPCFPNVFHVLFKEKGKDKFKCDI